MERMRFKLLIALVVNLLAAGFFGLAIAAGHFFWLEFATIRFPRVQYTENYQLAFALTCATGFFVAMTVRQIRTQFVQKTVSTNEIVLMLILITVTGFVLTPVPGGNFPRYLYEMSRPAAGTPAVEKVNAPLANEDMK